MPGTSLTLLDHQITRTGAVAPLQLKLHHRFAQPLPRPPNHRTNKLTILTVPRNGPAAPLNKRSAEDHFGMKRLKRTTTIKAGKLLEMGGIAKSNSAKKIEEQVGPKALRCLLYKYTNAPPVRDALPHQRQPALLLAALCSLRTSAGVHIFGRMPLTTRSFLRLFCSSSSQSVRLHICTARRARRPASHIAPPACARERKRSAWLYMITRSDLPACCTARHRGTFSRWRLDLPSRRGLDVGRLDLLRLHNNHYSWLW